ncbi:MAG: hypothetical protein GKS06_11850 [Acidobacteria bacterium]|nr:hypothetical protein [Acidobacteriota bacterium]
MSALRVARIPYLNSAPFYQQLAGAGFELVDMPPRELGRLASAGQVDAGILSLCDLLRDPVFDELGKIGISADGPAHSVLLFTRGELSDLEGGTIAITGETSTSFPLLRLLLETRHSISTDFARRPNGPQSEDVGHLLIGDAALRVAAAGGLVPGLADYSPDMIPLARPTEGDWTHVVDLGAAWKRWQGLPFVFARWAAATHVPTADREDLQRRINESLDTSSLDLRRVAATRAASAGLDDEAGRAYLEGFGYRLGSDEEAGQQRFIELLEATDWWAHDERLAGVEIGT